MFYNEVVVSLQRTILCTTEPQLQPPFHRSEDMRLL